MQSLLQSACDAARAGGRILLDQLGKAAVREKAPADLVTDADLASQQAVERLLVGRYPQHAFLGEESSSQDQAAAIASGKPVWVVDPLDGTANYAHRLPGFSVSIALVHGTQVQLGVIFDPLANSLYWATQSGPAMRDGKTIRCSGCQELSRALVCCSFPPGVGRHDAAVEHFLRILERSQSLRRLGSAALNMCYLAEGCLDAYWATSVKTWDVAAGSLIAERAGVCLSQIDGTEFDLWNPRLLAAASPELHQQVLAVLNAPPVAGGGGPLATGRVV